MSSAAGQNLTRTMPVSATGISVDLDDVDGDSNPGALKGFRKRWVNKPSGSPSEISEEDLVGKDPSLEVLEQSSAKKAKSADAIDLVEVVDETIDELIEQPEELPSSSKRPHQLERDALLGTNINVFKFPWEKGRLAKIFGNEPLVRAPSLKLRPGGSNPVQVNLRVGACGEVAAKAVVVAPVTTSATFMQVVRKVDDVEEVVDKSQKRRQALQGFWELLSLSVCSSTVGLKVTVEATADSVNDCALNILDAVFSVKSPGTLCRRMYSLQAYEQWCVDHHAEHWLPVSELRVWQYVQWLKSSKAAPTKASSLLEALRFSWFLLGVSGADEAEKSLRVKGISAQLKASKRPWRPADVFTLQEVLKLHSILEDCNEHLGDRVMTGHILHLIYSRSRWSDLCHVTNLYIDHDQRFLELTTRDHKGARSAELKSRLLPLVAPCKGITQDLWAVTYMKVRKLCNLSTPTVDPEPMMRAPMNLEATLWSKRALTSEEGADFIRRILKTPKTLERRLSTHSCKSTMISWTAKYGLSDSSRAVLARHMACVSASTAVYSRDLLSPILCELETMLQAMRCEMFHPDRSRSGMVTPSTMPVVPGTPFAVPVAPLPRTPAPLVQHQHASAECDGAESPAAAEQSLGQGVDERHGSSEEMFGNPELYNAVQSEAYSAGSPDSETTEEDSVQSTSGSEDDDVDDTRPEFLEPSQRYYMNEKSLVIHCERTEGVLKCGRRVSPHFVALYELHGIRCSRCFDI